MPEPVAVIDLHSHLIPGVDDGSRSVTQSVAVLQAMAAHGVTDVCLTPHLEASRAQEGVPAAYDLAFEQLRMAAPPQVRLHRGVELMLDRPLPPEAAANRALTLGGTRYLLVEFTRMVAPNAAYNALAHVASLGLIPVLAHPERYACTTPQVAEQWKATGALMQVDANTLLTERGRGERARLLVAGGMADLLAADNHGDSRMVAAAYVRLGELGGEEQADLLLRRNPEAILADRMTEQVRPLPFKTSLLARIRHLFDQEE
jgi:protein-tyrosine phosphatase